MNSKSQKRRSSIGKVLSTILHNDKNSLSPSFSNTGFFGKSKSIDMNKSSENICLMDDNPNRPFKLSSEGKVAEVEKLIVSDPEVIRRTDEYGRTILHHAILNNKPEMVDMLISFGSDIKFPDENGYYPIHMAIKQGSIEIVTHLITNGADINIRTEKEGYAPIHLCVSEKDMEMLNHLLTSPQLDINIQTNMGNNCAHLTCEVGFTKALDILLDGGLRVCQANKHGLYPIHLAIKHCQEECLRLIVSKATTCTATQIMNFADKEGNVPLHTAVNTGATKPVEMCLELGAKIDVRQNDNSTPVHYACTKGEYDIVKLMLETATKEIRDKVLTIRDNNGQTPLHKAVMFNHAELTSYLLEQGSNIEARDDNGWTPLLLAASRSNTKSFCLLVEFGANVLVKDLHERNILHLFTMNMEKKQGSLVRDDCTMKSVFAKLVNGKDDTGCTPLHYSTRQGLFRFTTELIQLGGLCMTQNVEKSTPLHFAARYGRVHTCRKLLNSYDGIKTMNSTDNQGKLPIHVAAENGHSNIIRLLLDRGCIFHRCYHGNTPLHYAAKNGHLDACQFLIEINPSLLDNQNHEGQTALHLAAIEDRSEILSLLLSEGAQFLIDKEGMNFFSYIIKLKNYHSATEVVNSDRWKEVIVSKDLSGNDPTIGLIKDMPSICSNIMDKSIATVGNRGQSDFKIIYSFTWLQNSTKSVDDKNIDPFHYVKTMVDLNRVDLLMHPLCTAYLKMKWDRFGKWIQYGIILSYLLFLSALSTIIIILSKTTFKHMETRNDTRCMEIKVSMFQGHDDWMYTIHIMGWITMIYSCISILKELIQLSVSKWEYIKDFGNYIDIALYISCIIFSQMIITNKITHSTMELAIVTIFLAWFNLLLLFFHFESVGIYVIMFIQILSTVIRVLLIFSILFIGFTFSFLLLFRVPYDQNDNWNKKDEEAIAALPLNITSCYTSIGELNQTVNTLDTALKAWQTFELSFLKVLMMMMGEYDYLATFIGPESDNNTHTFHYPALTYVFLVLFIVLMSILMMNLLIGLAVGDIESVRSNANLKRIALQVSWLSDFESKLHRRLRDWIFVEIYTVYPFMCRARELSPSESQIIYKKERPELETTGSLTELVEMQNRQIVDLSLETRRQLDLLKMIIEKMEIDPEVEMTDDLAPQMMTGNKYWKSGLNTSKAIGRFSKFKSLPDPSS